MFSPFRAVITVSVFLIAAALLAVIFSGEGIETPIPVVEEIDEGGCTTALISGSATADGRPLLWKNRDVSRWRQEFHFYDETPYDFIGVTYAGVDTECWGGINEAGFAIENANGLNLGSVTGPDDDGFIQYLALATCERVSDFRTILDSTNITGRTRPSIYGVFDRFGDGGMFECRDISYVFFNINDTIVAPDGILVRSNFGYTGDSTHIGQFRHNRALDILRYARSRGAIDARLILDYVARDIANPYVNPYPLPYSGLLGDTLFGCVRTHDAVNREITASCFVVHGIRPGENPLTGALWAQVGEPIMTPMLPLWVAAGSVPAAVDGDSTSPICDRAREFWRYLYLPYPDPLDDIIDTWRLNNGQGGGLLVDLRTLESLYYGRVRSMLESWRNNFPSQQRVESAQNRIASTVCNLMMRYNPSVQVEDIERRREGDFIRLSWKEITENPFGDEMKVKGYSVYHSEALFRDPAAAELVGFTSGTEYLVSTAEYLETGFFQVWAEPEVPGFGEADFDLKFE